MKSLYFPAEILLRPYISGDFGLQESSAQSPDSSRTSVIEIHVQGRPVPWQRV